MSGTLLQLSRTEANQDGWYPTIAASSSGAVHTCHCDRTNGDLLHSGVTPTSVDGSITVERAVRIYPNPSRDGRVFIELPESMNRSEARLQVIDASGRRVVDPPIEDRALSARTAVWDGRDASGRDLASGRYVVRLDSGIRVATARVSLIR